MASSQARGELGSSTWSTTSGELRERAARSPGILSFGENNWPSASAAVVDGHRSIAADARANPDEPKNNPRLPGFSFSDSQRAHRPPTVFDPPLTTSESSGRSRAPRGVASPASRACGRRTSGTYSTSHLVNSAAIDLFRFRWLNRAQPFQPISCATGGRPSARSNRLVYSSTSGSLR